MKCKNILCCCFSFFHNSVLFKFFFFGRLYLEEQLSVEKEKLGEEEKKYERIVYRKRKLSNDICAIRNEMKKIKRGNVKDNQIVYDNICESRSERHDMMQCNIFYMGNYKCFCWD